MDTVRIASPLGGTEIVLRGRRGAYEIECPFVPLEQVDFVDAVERTFDLYEIKRKEVGRCLLLFRTKNAEQSAGIIEFVEELFADYFKE